MQENDTILFGAEKNPQRSDLRPTVLSFSDLRPDVNDTVNITVAVTNYGEIDASSFNVRFSYNYTYPNGYNTQYLIGEQVVNNLVVDGMELVTIQTNVSLIGRNNVIVEVDTGNNITELNEINNQMSETIQVFDSNPIANLALPTNGAQYAENETVVFIGDGTDNRDSSLNESLNN